MPTALITGASSGIGAEFARRLAQQNYNLIIHGRRRELLEQLADEIKQKNNISIKIEIAELSSRAEVDRLAQLIKNTPDLEILINNAGYTTRENFHDEPLQAQLDLLHVHLSAALILTHAAIPIMLKNNKGLIINVSSVAGFFAAPRSAIYCATKAFLNTFTEAIHLELKDTPVYVQTLCPGFTISDFHKKLGYDPNDPCFKHFMTSEYVVERSLQAMQNKKLYCIPSFKYKFLVLMSRLTPKSLLHKLTLKYYSRKRSVKIGSK